MHIEKNNGALPKAASLAVISLAALLSACSKPNDAASSAAGNAAPQEQSANPAQRQITDALGRQVSVPAHPQKVVVLSELDLDSAIALGIVPAGSTYVRGQSNFQPYLAQQTQQVASVGNFGQPSMEAILALQPDLIIAGSMIDTQLLNQLNQIAPTAVSFARGESWKSSFKRVAEILNRQESADKALAAYAQNIQQAKAKLADQQGQAVSVTRWTANGPIYMYKDSFASQVLSDLGLARPAQQQQAGASHSAPISRERYDQIDAGWIIIGSSLPPEQQLNELNKFPEFKRLQAVKNNQYFAVDASMWTGVGGPNAANQAVADVLAHMPKS